MQCYHCDQRFEVGSKAMTVSCPSCFKPLMVQDLNIKTLEAVKRLETCGKIVILKKGRVMADRVVGMEGVEVEGIMHGNVRSGTPVRIAAGAEWKGDLEAPGIELDPSAVVLGGFWRIPTRVLSDEPPKKLADAEAASSSGQRAAAAARPSTPIPATPVTRKAPVRKASESTVRPRAVRKAEPVDQPASEGAPAPEPTPASGTPEPTKKPRVKIEPKPQRRTSILPEPKSKPDAKPADPPEPSEPKPAKKTVRKKPT